METGEWLSHFPSEVFSLLTERLSFQDISKLIWVGSKRLTSSLLRYGAVTTLDVEIPRNRIDRPTSWPGLLHRFTSLQSLTIEGSGARCIRFEPTNLPPTLRNIEILGYDLFDSFCSRAHFNVGEILPNLQIFMSNIELKRDMADWVKTWPASLTKFGAASFDFSIPLPSSLTHVFIDYVPTSILGESFAFPPHLTHVDLCFFDSDGVSSFAPLLPSSLQTLLLRPMSVYPRFTSTIWSALPSSLTSLKIEKTSTKKAPDISCLPLLTELDLVEMTTNQIFKLPLSLKTLCMEQLKASGAECKASSFVAALPRGLTSLSISTKYNIDGKLSGPIEIPPTLVKWNASCFDFSDNIAVQSLPSTITHLWTGKIGVQVTELPKLPQLKQFYAENLPMLPSLLNHLACHSNQMKILYVETSDIFVDGFITTRGSYQSERDIIALSRFNKISSFYDSDDLNHQIYRFSNRLERVTIDSCDHVGDKLLQKVLPNSIQSLVLNEASFLTDLGIQSLSTWTNLTELKILKCFKVTSASFIHLPRHLRMLETNTSLIYDQHIADLPRSLTSIFINSATNITDACVPYLPTSTTHLRVSSNTFLTPDIAYHLPFSSTNTIVESADRKSVV